jgi:hypothetical protein
METRGCTIDVGAAVVIVLQIGPLDAKHPSEIEKDKRDQFSRLTSLSSFLVHDTVAAFSAANGLSRLDVIFCATVFPLHF